MKIIKKCISVLFLVCIVASVTACGQKVTDTPAETDEVPETVETSVTETEAEAQTTAAPAVTTTVPETTTTATSTTEETTQTTTTATTTTTTAPAETTTTAPPPAITAPPATTAATMPVTAPPVETAAAAATAPPEETVPLAQRFEPGIWEASSSDGSRYFFFDTGSDSGSFRDQDSGLGMAFSYEVENDNTIIFHISETSDRTKATVSFSGTEQATLTWENGSTEKLSYLGLGNFNTFHFYSNVQLCEMALNQYEKQTGYRPGDASAQVQENGLIAIQLYDNMGDHNSTSAWYTVDKYTAQGTDLTGNSVDLTQ